jgi:hypothetical protein
MAEPEAPVTREAETGGLCCCVALIKREKGEMEWMDMQRCHGTTSGPDDPFCPDCTPRHENDPGVLSGMVRVEARLPRSAEDPKDRGDR